MHSKKGFDVLENTQNHRTSLYKKKAFMNSPVITHTSLCMMWHIILINPLQQELYRSPVVSHSLEVLPHVHQVSPKLHPQQGSEGGGRDRRGAAWLYVLQMAGVAEKVTVERVTAVTFFIIQLHLTFLTVIAFHMIVFVHGNDSNGFIRPLWG